VALVAGLAFFLNTFAGTFLQLRHLRFGLVLSQLLFLAVPALLAVRWFYLEPRATLALRRPAARHLAAAVIGTAGLNHLLTLAGGWQERVFPMPEFMRRFYESLLAWNGPLDFAGLLLAFAVVPAFCEELLFRGFLQAGLVRRFGSGAAGLTASALLFAAFHLDPWRFAGVLVLGLFLGWMVARSGSLVPAILGHLLNNALSIAAAVLGAGDDAAAAPGGVAGAGAAVLLTVASILLMRGRGAVREAGERVL
jgi:membrane protease YdiL (CAAX protease family)